MRLTDLLRFQNVSNESAQGLNHTNVQSDSQVSTQYRIYSQIKNMMPGDTISGEIISVNGSELQILTEENSILNAKLEQTMNLLIGQNIIFEVTKNSDQVALRALFTNVAQQQTVLKALKEANIAPSNENIKMVSQMMKEEMPIDKNSLSLLYKEKNMYKEATVDDIISLHKLKLPVNQGNLNQIENYKNFQYQIINQTEKLLDMIKEQCSSRFVENINPEEVNVLKEIGEELFPERSIQELLKTVLPEEQENISILQKSDDAIVLQKNQPKNVADQTVTQNMTENKENSPNNNQATVKELLSVPEREELFERIDQLPVSKELKSLLKSDNTSASLVIEILTKMKEQEVPNKLVDACLKSEGYFKLLKNEVINRITIDPNHVKSAEIKDLYYRLQSQTSELMKTVTKAFPEGSVVVSQGQNISENIDFITQLNQTMSYVQLPVKINGKNATGDLYVYRNKNKQGNEDDGVSALLHLGLEHLGNLDIFVSLKNSNVKTKFIVEDDNVLDFLSNNMDILTKRLNQRGYQTSFQVELRKEEKNVMEEILIDNGKKGGKEEMPSDFSMKYSFDVRA